MKIFTFAIMKTYGEVLLGESLKLIRATAHGRTKLPHHIVDLFTSNRIG